MTIETIYLSMPSPETSLDDFIDYIAAAAPQLVGYLPTHNDEVTFRPVKDDGTLPGYDEPWVSPRVSIPLQVLGITSNGRWCVEMHYRPAGTRTVTDANGAPVILSGSVENDDAVYQTVATTASAEWLMWLERAPGLTIADLPPLITTYAASKPVTNYTPPAELQAQGAPAAIATPENGGGMRMFTPTKPRVRYS